MSAKYTFAVYETIVGSATQKLILLKLADNANDDGIAWPGMDYLSKHCELSKSAILRNLKALEEKGFIRVKRRKSSDGKTNLSNVYQLTIGTSSQLPPSSAQTLPPSSSELPKSNNIKSNKESKSKFVINDEFLNLISEYWNSHMGKYSPSIYLTKNTQINKKRIASIKRVIKDYPDYSDHEYWDGHISMLAKLPDLQWQRENKQLTFDQCLQATKFERNLGYMKMGAV